MVTMKMDKLSPHEPRIKKTKLSTLNGAAKELSTMNDAATIAATNDDDDIVLELKCINTIRALSADIIQKAKSGHPGAPLGCAPIAHILWTEVLQYSPSTPNWWNRDRFVLSNGHACALQYSLLHLTGYQDLTVEQLKQFRQLNSTTPGHPESFVTQGIEVCTGPLGQGIANAVGMAMAERHLAATYGDEIMNHSTYVLCGDGCLQEGVSSEACSLAGHLGLGKLCVLYDDNSITIDGSTDLSFTENIPGRFESQGWHVQTVADITGDLNDLREAIRQARANTDQPSLICVKTRIGEGSDKVGTAGVHGAPLGDADIVNLKQTAGLDSTESFDVEEDVQEMYHAAAARVEAQKEEWDQQWQKYQTSNPEQAKELQRRFDGELPEGIFDKLPGNSGKADATRKCSQACLNVVGPKLPELMGGSADLTPSNLTAFTGCHDFQKDTPDGRYIRFGVREHAMAAISNGLYAHGAIRPYCATFLVFSGYAMGAIRLSALSQFPVLYLMTHDSIGLGEDGPTHQPIETLESLRSIPNLHVVRPADGEEMAAAYRMGLESTKTPTVICCSRGGIPALEQSSREKALQGAYIVVQEEDSTKKCDLVLLATGSEVSLCVQAAAALSSNNNIRVVSMPCQEVFLAQSSEYQESILPGDVPTLSVEASCSHGWHRFAHVTHSIDNSFGKSGPAKAVFEYFGFTPENIATKAQKVMDYYSSTPVPNLRNRPTF
mmetsp:Transcript_1516/g.2227  ORF Transcript_1516/g.2227 Transcript_1516/m.2227 type:complete len:721 (+) Transcript_1516:289-2451(+)|eukprot:CAMPEP_0194200464 /NCGR_PEP_ID=MMETSP0156-20130528/1055_1 /TAXON_ID=33649 /ORGANISM="Thalassionema nitzschioides, Strain L26-B" /LENGTH=720 /DNA_ID=CAMNT_0038925461 /DNA_START=238 /DNA_END=2400 /DNA_ORIENTATION=+